LLAVLLAAHGVSRWDPEPHPFGDPVLGALRVRRYGHAANGIVWVEVCAHLFMAESDGPTCEA